MSEYTQTLSGIVYPDFRVTFNVASGVTENDIGKAVVQDTSAAGTVKLGAAGDMILGRLFALEDRTAQGGGLVGTVELKGGMKLPYTAGQTIAIGDKVVCDANGLVKKGEGEGLLVWEVDTAAKTVTVLIV